MVVIRDVLLVFSRFVMASGVSLGTKLAFDIIASQVKEHAQSVFDVSALF